MKFKDSVLKEALQFSHIKWKKMENFVDPNKIQNLHNSVNKIVTDLESKGFEKTAIIDWLVNIIT